MTPPPPPGRGRSHPPTAPPRAAGAQLWADAADTVAGQAAELGRLAAAGAGIAASLRADGHAAMAALVDTAVAALRNAEGNTLAAAGALAAATDGRLWS